MLDMITKLDIDKKKRELSERIELNEQYVVNVYKELRGFAGESYKYCRDSLRSTIGGLNTRLVDVHYSSFVNAEDYVSTWLQGLNREFGDRVDNNTGEKTFILIQMLSGSDRICIDYILDRLKLTFYRNYEAYTRKKPPEELEIVWFGDNHHCFGLPITPVIRNGLVVNDHSEIRNAPFHYWTLKHIISTGLIDIDKRSGFYFSGVDDLIGFLRHFPPLSGSPHEYNFLNKYIEYLEKSSNRLDEPLLIPEYRYGDNDICHKWRTDFLVLNSYTNRFVAIELSPISTHNNWEKEMRKRNDFLEKCNIEIITFTDSDLLDINNCFGRIQKILCDRGNSAETIESALSRIIAPAISIFD